MTEDQLEPKTPSTYFTCPGCQSGFDSRPAGGACPVCKKPFDDEPPPAEEPHRRSRR
jgi:predicted amidophosphoribosyltransferase